MIIETIVGICFLALGYIGYRAFRNDPKVEVITQTEAHYMHPAIGRALSEDLRRRTSDIVPARTSAAAPVPPPPPRGREARREEAARLGGGD